MPMHVNDAQISVKKVGLLSMCQPIGESVGAWLQSYMLMEEELTLKSAQFNFPHIAASTRTHIFCL